MCSHKDLFGDVTIVSMLKNFTIKGTSESNATVKGKQSVIMLSTIILVKKNEWYFENFHSLK